MKNGQNCLVSFAFWREISPEASVRMTLLCRYQSIDRPVCKWQYPVLFSSISLSLAAQHFILRSLHIMQLNATFNT